MVDETVAAKTERSAVLLASKTIIQLAANSFVAVFVQKVGCQSALLAGNIVLLITSLCKFIIFQKVSDVLIIIEYFLKSIIHFFNGLTTEWPATVGKNMDDLLQSLLNKYTSQNVHRLTL